MLKRTLIVIFMAVMTVPVVASPCWACSCAATTDPQADRERQAEHADLIFTGIAKSERVVDPTPNDGYTGDETVLTRFRVRKTYKGHPGRWVTIRSAANGAACGYDFDEGRRYTVFAREDRDGYETDLCSGTKSGRIDPERYGLASGDD